ncbi:hypothetical protein K0B96_16725 [Horticoccus luteus]|uniref:Uncharacterized protein n=1 Tax=Horticoccus luteus TaxID=2862869 RepID=A0A8F9XL73_9BACT|nr:hypothetical protein [Horticoccus luteus]QYM78926.1 hypothetical protein K0B96_16725 [Horticoccus luteus]
MSFPLLKLPVRCALLPLAFVLTMFVAACGGGGGGGGTPPTPPPPVPDLAPASIANHTIVIADPDQPTVTSTYAFSASTYTSPGGDSGTYSYGKVAGTTTQAQLQIASTFNPVRTYTLTFTSSAGGTYVDQVGKHGTFQYQ